MRATIALVATSSVAFAVGTAWGADPDARPAATPYRPTVSTPAALSAPHWLEGEFGGLLAIDQPLGAAAPRRASLPYSLKYAFSDDWGVRINGEAAVHVGGDDRESGFGDTGVVVKRRFALDDRSAFGLEAGASFPTARPRLRAGSGQPDYSINGIYSIDIAGWHADANLIGTRLGSPDDASRWQTVAAVAASHPLSDRWTFAGEFSGSRERGAPGTAQFLAALSWAPRPDAVFDFGAARGLNRATTTWQAFTGLTVVLGRVD